MRREDWWNTYVGLPYQEKGRGRSGCDCWGLYRMAAAEQFGIDLPSLADQYDLSERDKIAELIATRREGWQPSPLPKAGDLALFRIGGSESHLGMITRPGYFLHAREGQDSVIERLDSPAWKHRLVGIYRYVPNSAALDVVACPHPLKTLRLDAQMPTGMTLAAMAEEIRRQSGISRKLPKDAVIAIDGEYIPRERWAVTVPPPGARVEYRAVMRGSGAGRMLAMIAIMVVAWYAAPLIVGTAATSTAAATGLGGSIFGLSSAASIGLVSAGINMVGGLLLNAIFPVRPPSLGGTGAGPRPMSMLQGGSNQPNKYGAVPVVLGRYRFTPPLGAETYVESNGSKSYLRMMLVWGFGPLQISDLRVGNTPLTDYEEVEIETLTGWDDTPEDLAHFNSLYGADVEQQAPGVKLEAVLKDVDSASRSSNVITVSTDGPHGQSIGNYVTMVKDASVANVFSGVVATNPTTTSFTAAAGALPYGAVDADLVQPTIGQEIAVVSAVVADIDFVKTLTVTTATNFSAYGPGTDFVLKKSSPAAIYSGEVSAVPSDYQLQFPHAGANGAIVANRITGSGYTERTLVGEVDKITVTLHYPQGLFGMSATSSKTLARTCNVSLQVRQVGETSWAEVAEKIPGRTLSIPPAWYNTDSDAALESVYRWTRISLSKTNQIIVRHGAVTTDPDADPSGALLARLQAENFGFESNFLRLPVLAASEEGLWDICVHGNTVHATVDRRGSAGLGSVTGCALVMSGLAANIDAGSITRSQTETVSLTKKTKKGFSVSTSFYVPHGLYAVRARRTNSNAGMSNPSYDECYLQTITGYTNGRPVNFPKPLARSALLILATNQLNGTVDGITGTVQSICKDYDYTTGTWVTRATRNPASLLRYLWQHPANARRRPDSKINLVALADFHDWCRTKGFTYDGVLTGQRSLDDVARDIAAAGRASTTTVDGKKTVIIDRPRSEYAQAFTPHNSWGFEGTKALPVIPDAFRVTFANAAAGDQPDERIVYNDGFSAANANLYEALHLPGVTSASAVYQHARFHFAQLKLRPETYTLYADWEHLVCTRGDLVAVAHDVPMWGGGDGRIKNRITSTILEIDEDFAMDAGVQYTLRIRLADGTFITRTVAAVSVDGYYSQLTLTAGVDVNQGEPGNMVMFGSLNAESVDCIVLGIEPAEHQSARLTLVDYSPAVYDSDTEVIPAHASQITKPPNLLLPTITARPTITRVASDETVMVRVSPGKYVYNIRVSFHNPETLGLRVSHIEGQIDFDEDKTDDWQATALVPVSAGAITFGDVEEGDVYRFRLRYVDSRGRAGPWTAVQTHTVVGRVNPPSAITEISVRVSGDRLIYDWPDADEVDVTRYEARVVDTAWGVADSNRVYFGGSSSMYYVPTAPGTVTLYFRSRDDAGNWSPTTSKSYTYAFPAAPASITESWHDTSTTTATITLDWPDVSPPFGLSHYLFDGAGATKTVKSSTITLPANWLGDRTFTVRTVNMLGAVSDPVSKTVTKLRPNAPTGVRAQVIDNTVMLYWTVPAKTTLPISHIRIKKGATWATAADVGTKSGAFTTINELVGGSYTYWLAAVDTDGYESTPVSISAKVSAPPDFIFHGSFDSAFAGTLSSSVKDSGGVVLPVNTTETWAQHFSTRGWASPAAQVAAGYPVFIQPGAASGYYRETFDFGTVLASSQVSVSWTGVTKGGTPVVTPKIELSDDNATWTAHDGVALVFGTNFRYVRVTITVTGDGDDIYRLTELSCRCDAKQKTDSARMSCVSTDASGTVVNFNKEFIDVEAITVTAEGTTPITPVYAFTDAVLSGTYSITSGVATVNVAAHGLVVGQQVKLNFVTGTAEPVVATVATVPTTGQFTAAVSSANTSGNLSIYWQSARIYLFNNAGGRVSAVASVNIRGY